MQPNNVEGEVITNPVAAKESIIAPLCKPTPLSKYLALALFVTMPFVGGFVGWQIGSSEASLTTGVVPQGDLNLPALDMATDQSEQEIAVTAELATEVSSDAPLTTEFVQLQDGKSIVSETYGIMGYRRASDTISLIATNGSEEAIRNVDTVSPQTFYVAKNYSIYAHDTKRVFVEGQEVRGADSQSFTPIVAVPSNLEVPIAIGRDSHDFYVYSTALVDVDVNSFVPLAPFGRIFYHMGIDADNLYVFGIKYQDESYDLDAVTKTPFVLDSGKAFQLSDTKKIKISYENESVAATYPVEYASWYDFRFGLLVNGTSYLNNGYITDGAMHYAMYSVCIGISEYQTCERKFAIVEEPGQIPQIVLEAIVQYGVTNQW